jgi:hypothetical protein
MCQMVQEMDDKCQRTSSVNSPVVGHSLNTAKELPSVGITGVSISWRTTYNPHAVGSVAATRLGSSEVDVPATTKLMKLRSPETL